MLSSDRVPPLPREELPGHLQAAHDEAIDFVHKHFGADGLASHVSDGALIGLFAPLLHLPEVQHSFIALINSLAKLNDVSPLVKEVVILVTAAAFGSRYALHNHRAVGLALGLSASQVDTIMEGEKPGDLSDECKIALDAAQELSGGTREMCDETWRRSMSAFGTAGTLTIVSYVGMYSFI